jgi:hypothetical protein
MLASAWAGFLVGLSFLAMPVKFMAPSLTLPVALDVGRQTFFVFNRSEIMLPLLMLLLVVPQVSISSPVTMGAAAEERKLGASNHPVAEP